MKTMNELNNTKKCQDCLLIKDLLEFNISRSDKSGRQGKCRECEKIYKNNNLDRIHILAKRRYWGNVDVEPSPVKRDPITKQRIFKTSEEIKLRKDEYREKNKEREKIQKKQYYLENKEKITQIHKKYREENKDAINKQKSEYQKLNRDKMSAKNRRWRAKNLEYHRNYMKEYQRIQRKTNPSYYMGIKLRERIKNALKRQNTLKTTSFQELTGCDNKFLKIHIESQFTEGMTWEKYLCAEIVVDHIEPCASFDLTKIEEQKKCFHYTNLRPLWELDNKKKISSDITKSLKMKAKRLEKEQNKLITDNIQKIDINTNNSINNLI